MMNKLEFDEELMAMIGAVRDERITQAQVQRLEVLLADSAPARRTYLLAMHIHGMLEQSAAAIPTDPVPKSDYDRPMPHRSGLFILAAAMTTLAALLLVAFTAGWLLIVTVNRPLAMVDGDVLTDQVEVQSGTDGQPVDRAARDGDAFRVVAMENREYEFGWLQPMVIHDKSDLERLPALVDGAGVPEEQEALRAKVSAIIDMAKLNFDKEALVLLPHQEGSGSIELTFRRPVLKNGTLICRISRQVPEVLTDDVASYCFALVVKRAAVRKVELYVDDGKVIELPVSGMPPAPAAVGEGPSPTED